MVRDPSRDAPVPTSPADVTFQRRAARSPPPTGGASRSEPEPHIEANHPRAKRRPRQPAAEPGPPFREVLVIRTHADTDGAVAVLSDPEAEALLGVDGPLGNTDEVRAVVHAVTRRVVRDRFRRARVGAALTNITKLLDAERSWLVMAEGQIREDLAEPHSRAELFRNEKPVPSVLAEAGLDSIGNGKRAVVETLDGAVAEISNVLTAPSTYTRSSSTVGVARGPMA